MNDDLVSRQDVEDMLQNALPSRGMWEIEGDVVKNTVCETVADLMMDLEKLPSANVQPEITLESAIDYLHNIGWMQDHDKQMYEKGMADAKRKWRLYCRRL